MLPCELLDLIVQAVYDGGKLNVATFGNDDLRDKCSFLMKCAGLSRELTEDAK